MAPVDSRDYVLSRIYYSVLEPHRCAKHNVACQHPHQTRYVASMLVQSWPTVCDAAPVSNQHWFNASCLLGVQWHAGLVVLTAGGEYKPTPTQCLLNIRPALRFLASIHSALVSTPCWRYRHDALNQSWVNVGPPSVTLAHI